jgi:hypothetical protein
VLKLYNDVPFIMVELSVGIEVMHAFNAQTRG